MKVKHIELIRAVLLSGIAVSCVEITADSGIVKEFNDFMSSNNMSNEQMKEYLKTGYSLSLLFGFRLEHVCSDYKEIENTYNFIVSRVAELMEVLGIQDDPVKVFAMFVYLYRSGYLSYNKEFYYSTDMKDMSSLNGVDVVRGTGVCRSISSMFTDVCQCLDYTAANLSVNVKNGVLGKQEGLSTVSLKDKDDGKKFARFIGKITSIIPLGNHLVTFVSTEDKALVFDPTNDVIMNMDSFRKYSLANDTGAKMTYSCFSNIVPSILGQIDLEVNVFGLNKASKKDNVQYEDFCSTYKEVLELIKDNEDIFEVFYESNLDLYKKIYDLTELQHGLIKRVVPFIPGKKRK